MGEVISQNVALATEVNRCSTSTITFFEEKWYLVRKDKATGKSKLFITGQTSFKRINVINRIKQCPSMEHPMAPLYSDKLNEKADDEANQ